MSSGLARPSSNKLFKRSCGPSEPCAARAHEKNGGQRQNALSKHIYFLDISEDFVIRIQAASRTHLAKSVTHASFGDRLSGIFSAPSLTHLARDVRYARAEAALRVALSQCDTEPSPLELQVRVMEKGLRAWNARAGRGYERVRRAEETLTAAARQDTGSAVDRGSMSELQREKWMGMRERDEALEMVEKIKSLIAELNMDIREGLKTLPKAESSSRALRHGIQTITSEDAISRKAPILFSGKLPSPYLDNLPRSRRSVEPLRLPSRQLHVADNGRRPRSSPVQSEPTVNAPSTPSTSCPSSPTTPTQTFDDFGAALIHTPLPPKSIADYLAELDGSTVSGAIPASARTRARGHARLPSYVDNLLEKFSEDRIENGSLGLDTGFEPWSPSSSSPYTNGSGVPEIGQHTTRPGILPAPTPTKRSKAFLGRPFSSPPIAPSTPIGSPVGSPRAKENHDPAATPRHNRLDSAAFEKLLQTFSSAQAKRVSASSSSFAPGSPAWNGSQLAPTPVLQSAKSPGRMGNIVDSVRKGVKRAVRSG